MRAYARVLVLLRWLSMIALVFMMGITIVDVSLRLLVNELVLGSVEIVQLALVASVFLALPETFLRDEHIAVDAIDQRITPATLRRVRSAGALVTCVFLLVLAWRMVPPALDTLEIGDRTSDLQLSLFYYWVPTVVGGIASAVAMLLVVARRGSARDEER